MNSKTKEKYKIYEYSTHTELVPLNKSYTHCIFFFAGFNELASKYIYLYKNFLESNKFYGIKVIIPNLPTYGIEHSTLFDSSFIEKFKKIQSWYKGPLTSLKNLSDLEKGENKETTDFILNYVLKEIKILGSEKIILGGFSQGCFYALLSVLTRLNCTLCFVFLFKSPLKIIFSFESFPEILNNHLHMYFSRFDKIVNITFALESISIIKKSFKNVFISADNGSKHEVDTDCLSYLKKLIEAYVYNGKKIVKF